MKHIVSFKRYCILKASRIRKVAKIMRHLRVYAARINLMPVKNVKIAQGVSEYFTKRYKKPPNKISVEINKTGDQILVKLPIKN